MAIRTESISEPIRSGEDVLRLIEILSLLDAMGLLRIEEPIGTIDGEVLRQAVAAAAEAGIGRDVLRRMSAGRLGSRGLSSAIEQLRQALNDSPAPLHEVREQLSLFGPDGLAALAGSSPASLRRYASGLRTTPDRLAGRLHWLARVVAELRGAYNDAGVRRWFERRRTQLAGRAPAELLSGDWDPADEGPASILELARGLRGGGAT
jgi:hypothetical protein